MSVEVEPPQVVENVFRPLEIQCDSKGTIVKLEPQLYQFSPLLSDLANDPRGTVQWHLKDINPELLTVVLQISEAFAKDNITSQSQQVTHLVEYPTDQLLSLYALALRLRLPVAAALGQAILTPMIMAKDRTQLREALNVVNDFPAQEYQQRLKENGQNLTEILHFDPAQMVEVEAEAQGEEEEAEEEQEQFEEQDE